VSCGADRPANLHTAADHRADTSSFIDGGAGGCQIDDGGLPRLRISLVDDSMSASDRTEDMKSMTRADGQRWAQSGRNRQCGGRVKDAKCDAMVRGRQTHEEVDLESRIYDVISDNENNPGFHFTS
jgi:hypothetical protein